MDPRPESCYDQARVAIRIKCPGCSRLLTARDEAAGKKIRCSGCATVLGVPAVRKPAAGARPATKRRAPPKPVDELSEAAACPACGRPVMAGATRCLPCGAPIRSIDRPRGAVARLRKPEISYYLHCWTAFGYPLAAIPLIVIAVIGFPILFVVAMFGLAILTRILGPLFGLVALGAMLLGIAYFVGYFWSWYLTIIYESALGHDQFPTSRVCSSMRGAGLLILLAIVYYVPMYVLLFGAMALEASPMAVLGSILWLGFIYFILPMVMIAQTGDRLSLAFTYYHVLRAIFRSFGPYLYLHVLQLATFGISLIASFGVGLFMSATNPGLIMGLVGLVVISTIQIYLTMTWVRCIGIFACHYRERLKFHA